MNNACMVGRATHSRESRDGGCQAGGRAGCHCYTHCLLAQWRNGAGLTAAALQQQQVQQVAGSAGLGLLLLLSSILQVGL